MIKLLTFAKKSIIVITSEYRTLPCNEMTHCVTEIFWLRKADNFLLTRGNRRGNTSEEAEFDLVFCFMQASFRFRINFRNAKDQIERAWAETKRLHMQGKGFIHGRQHDHRTETHLKEIR